MQIIFAREFLKEVRMKPDQVKYLVTNARNGMCQGHRAELFAVKAAQACAALAVSPPPILSNHAWRTSKQSKGTQHKFEHAHKHSIQVLPCFCSASVLSLGSDESQLLLSLCHGPVFCYNGAMLPQVLHILVKISDFWAR